MAVDKLSLLRSEYEKQSRRATCVAYLIVVGLLVEIVEPFVLGKSWAEIALTVLGATLIALGVWGELHFADKAKKASDDIVAEALDRAALAQEQLAEYRARRRLSPEQMEAIGALLKPHSPMTFDIWLSALDQEFLGLADILAVTAIWGEWAYLSVPAGVMHGTMVVGLGGSFLNIEVTFAFDAPQNVKDAARVFAAELSKAGVAASHRPLMGRVVGELASRAAIHIRIGRKT